jgi:RNA polymerase sigma-70 factor (TIGR02960 family)
MTTHVQEREFRAMVEPYRRALEVHCYRMLGSIHDAEDVVQETFLRAWSALDRFEGRSSPHTWLYRIATNACLDELERRPRRPEPVVDPYPDARLPADEGPGARMLQREGMEIAFLTAIQRLPPRQRAVLLLRDVLEWSAEETAQALDLTVQSANSALQRARATLKQHGQRTQDPTPEEQELLRRFIDAHERADAQAELAIAREDIKIAMPPLPMRFTGHAEILPLMAEGLTGPGEWRLVATSANRLPTAASYLREWGGTEFKAFKLDVLRIEDGKIAEITTFNAELFPQFGLSPTLPG